LRCARTPKMIDYLLGEETGVARVDGLNRQMSLTAGTADHLSESDRAARCPTGKVPAVVQQVGGCQQPAGQGNPVPTKKPRRWSGALVEESKVGDVS
jgi:hypothetical protein